jgi:hypothetical protein
LRSAGCDKTHTGRAGYLVYLRHLVREASHDQHVLHVHCTHPSYKWDHVADTPHEDVSTCSIDRTKMTSSKPSSSATRAWQAQHRR